MRLSALLIAMMAAAAVAMAGLLVGHGPASAQSTPNTITVDTAEDESTDDGDCSLREAIESANADSGQVDGCAAGSGEDEIVFDVGPSATITLGSQLPQITDADGLSIDGENASITISGNDAVRVFHVNLGAKLALARLTVADGFTIGNGSGTVNDGTLTVTNSTFSGNSTQFSGGGIKNNATLTVTNSTFSGNSAFNGGGIYNSVATTLTVTSSTFSENSASQGGAIENDGTATLKNTIMANSPSGGNCSNFETLTDGGYNIDDGTTCGFSTTNNSQPSTNPLLDSNGLQDNGGPTKTIALQATSPAIDKGNSFGSTSDQRSVQRPQDAPAIENAPGGDGSDIGAFEVVNAPPVAQNDSYTIQEGKRSLRVPASAGVLANDSDPEGDALTVRLVRAPQVGTLKLRKDGSFVYEMPKKMFLRNEFNGVAFVYEVRDELGNTDRAKVTINKG